MKYKDPNMEKYWNTLPPEVQTLIEKNDVEVCSLGMLHKLGEYYRNDASLNSSYSPPRTE